MFDPDAFAGELARHTKAAIAKATQPLLDRIAALEAKEAPSAGAPGRDGRDGEKGADGLNGKDGADGKSVDPEDVRPMIEELVVRAVADLPPAKDGRDGKDGADGMDGKSVSAADVEAMVSQFLGKAISSMPAPQPGRDGRDGKDGADGMDGKSVSAADVEAMVSQFLGKAISSMPAPQPGRDGRDGKDGKDGLPGADGRDGFGLTDFHVDQPDEKHMRVRFIGSDIEKEGLIRLAGFWDEGVYQADRETPYLKGDAVTFGGSSWFAQQDNPPGAPGTENSGWRLAVKKGRDASR